MKSYRSLGAAVAATALLVGLGVGPASPALASSTAVKQTGVTYSWTDKARGWLSLTVTGSGLVGSTSPKVTIVERSAEVWPCSGGIPLTISNKASTRGTGSTLLKTVSSSSSKVTLSMTTARTPDWMNAKTFKVAASVKFNAGGRTYIHTVTRGCDGRITTAVR